MLSFEGVMQRTEPVLRKGRVLLLSKEEGILIKQDVALEAIVQLRARPNSIVKDVDEAV